MFTGIISQTSQLKRAKKDADGLVISIKKPKSWADLQLGESVSVNGVCLTVDSLTTDEMNFRLMAETLTKTTFGKKPPAAVNLERALMAGERLGGHFVQGHVDCLGKVIEVSDNGGRWLKIQFPAKYRDLLAYKGSIAIDGVSLTIAKLSDDSFSVSLVEYTTAHTTLGSLKVDDQVNIEFDMIAKHVAQIIKRQ